VKDILRMQAEVCKTFAHPKRLEIIKALDGVEMTASELLGKVDVSKANLSQHMRLLSEKGLVNARKKGLNVFYRLSSPDITRACTLMRQVLIQGLEQKNRILQKAKRA
jgi:ArsR family transcriptional regulator